jgi:hypothetical protein
LFWTTEEYERQEEDSVVGLCDESSRKVKIIEGIVIIAVVPKMERCCILSGNALKNSAIEFLHSVSHSSESRAMHRGALTDRPPTDFCCVVVFVLDYKAPARVGLVPAARRECANVQIQLEEALDRKAY